MLSACAHTERIEASTSKNSRDYKAERKPKDGQINVFKHEETQFRSGRAQANMHQVWEEEEFS